VRIDSLLQDVRYAFRVLRRTPLFAATVAATMGLGLGLVGSAFTLLNAYILKPIDVPNPRSLYALSWDTETTRRHRFGLADYEALQRDAKDFSRLAAMQDVSAMRDAVSMRGLLVTGNYFELLGTKPALGRLLRSDDATAPGAGAVVVLNYNAWRSRFGADPTIVGQQITLGRQRYEVIGVTEPLTTLPGQELISFWAPLTMARAFATTDPWSDPDAATLFVVGRLRAEATAQSAHAWLDVWLRQRFPPPSDAMPVTVLMDSLATRIPLNRETAIMFSLLMSAFGLVLLVACANVTNLMLARALARQPEITVRLALGASRWRVARQLIVESLMLAVPAAVVGLALIAVTARVFPTLIVSTFPSGIAPVENVLMPLDPDVRVMAFLSLAAMLSAVLITLAPTFRLTRARLAQGSRGEASPDARGSRLRSGLVAVQIGACALFLVGAVGMLDESARLANPDTNLDYERVGAVGFDQKVRAAVALRLAADPVVEQIAAAWEAPMTGPLPSSPVTASTTRIAQSVGVAGVSDEYFSLFKIPIVRGRAFSRAEADAGAPVVVVTEATAAALWPGLDPLGQTLDLSSSWLQRTRRVNHQTVRVVGVTENAGSGSFTDGSGGTAVYFATGVGAAGEMALLVRGRTDDFEAMKAALGTAVDEVAPDTAFQLIPIPTMVGAIAWIFQAFSVTASILGVVGLLLAYSGTYAVVSFLVAQRTREFGLRMALGASSWRIVWGMTVETLRTTSIGLAVGLAVAAGLVRLANGSIELVPDFGVRPYVVGAAFVLMATAVAALSPLRRAARIDPAQALRAE
jgi:predicted permease